MNGDSTLATPVTADSSRAASLPDDGRAPAPEGPGSGTPPVPGIGSAEPPISAAVLRTYRAPARGEPAPPDAGGVPVSVHTAVWGTHATGGTGTPTQAPSAHWGTPAPGHGAFAPDATPGPLVLGAARAFLEGGASSEHTPYTGSSAGPEQVAAGHEAAGHRPVSAFDGLHRGRGTAGYHRVPPAPRAAVGSGDARETSGSRATATRRWVGHRPLSEQPDGYRPARWSAEPVPSGRRDSDSSAGAARSGRATEGADGAPWPEPHEPDGASGPVGSPETEPQGSPWLDPDEEETLKERRPPPGYVEADTDEEADPPLHRLAQWWGPDSALSRRAVVALFVLGAAAVLAAVLFLRREPDEVDVPEMMPQAAPEGEEGDGQGQPGGDGGGPSGDGEGAEPDGDVVVHVGGEVEDPGLYTLPPGSRVSDAVEEAGGALPESDLDVINLARPVVDGERILLGGQEVGGAAENGSGDGDGTGGEGISLNQSDSSALESLPGIGEAKAEAIVEHRESLGGSFSSVEDLLDVSGIGQATFDNLEEHVTL